MTGQGAPEGVVIRKRKRMYIWPGRDSSSGTE